MGDVVNKAEFARLTGYSARAISDWIKQGMPAEGTGKKGSPVRIDTAKAIEWMCRRRVERELPEQREVRSREEEELRLTSARANKIEAEDALLRRESCRVEEARQALLGIGAVVVSELGSLPGRLAHVMQETDDPAEAREQLDEECRRVRARMADRLEAAGGSLGDGEIDPSAAEANRMAVGRGEARTAG